MNNGQAHKGALGVDLEGDRSEEQEAARIRRAAELPHTAITDGGDYKAKARLVILGFQHPDLATDRLRTTSPVVSHAAKLLV